MSLFFSIIMVLFFTVAAEAEANSALEKEITKIKKYIAEGNASPEMLELLKNYEHKKNGVSSTVSHEQDKTPVSKEVVHKKPKYNANASVIKKEHPPQLVSKTFSVGIEREPASKPPIFPLPIEVQNKAAPPVVDPLNGITISGLLDFYYSYNFNKPLIGPQILNGGSTVFPGNNSVRYYDIYHSQMTLNLAELTIKKSSSEVNYLLDLDFGQMADLNTIVVSSSGTSIDEVSKHIGQAYLTFTPKWAPGLSIDVGKMATHVGFEYIKSKDNWQYSRATIFGYGGPFWHTGVHVAYEWLPKEFSTSFYIYNGWNTIYENNSAKTLGGQLKWAPSDSLSLIYNMITGPEKANNNSDYKTVHEMNAAYAVTPEFIMAIDVLVGEEKNVDAVDGNGTTVNLKRAQWQGGTIGFKWKLSEKTYLSPRYEYYNDKHGYTLGGGPQKMKSITLTGSAMVADGLETRLEYRHDSSDYQQRFLKANSETTSSQSTLTWSLMYSF